MTLRLDYAKQILRQAVRNRTSVTRLTVMAPRVDTLQLGERAENGQWHIVTVLHIRGRHVWELGIGKGSWLALVWWPHSPPRALKVADLQGGGAQGPV